MLIPKPDKDIASKEDYKSISLINVDSKILKILADQIQQYVKRVTHHHQFCLP